MATQRTRFVGGNPKPDFTPPPKKRATIPSTEEHRHVGKVGHDAAGFRVVLPEPEAGTVSPGHRVLRTR